MSGIFTAISTFFKEGFTGWKRWESATLLLSCIIIVALSFYWQDSLLGIISSVTGVAYTVCNGAGRRIAYLFGIVNSVLYGFIAFNAQIYGDAALYLLYYLPAMVVGLILWSRNMDAEGHEVVKRVMNARRRVLLCAVCIAGVIAGAFVLQAVGDALPLLDSFTTVISVIALVVALGRYAEQWVLWTSVNAVEVVLWSVRLVRGGAMEAGSSLIMWVLFLVIGVIMWVRWARQLKQCDRAVAQAA